MFSAGPGQLWVSSKSIGLSASSFALCFLLLRCVRSLLTGENRSVTGRERSEDHGLNQTYGAAEDLNLRSVQLLNWLSGCSCFSSSLSKLPSAPTLSIIDALVAEPYSVTSHLLQKLSSRQPEILLQWRLQLLCNIHEENQHGCLHAPEFNYSAKPLLRGAEPSFVHVSELIVWAHRHLAETWDGLFI